MTTPPYISLLFPVITLDTVSTPRPRVVLFLYMITDPRNLNEGVPLPVDYWSAGPHTTTKSAYYTNDNITYASTIKHTQKTFDLPLPIYLFLTRDTRSFSADVTSSENDWTFERLNGRSKIS